MYVVILLSSASGAEFPEDQECPADCDCHYFRVNYVTDCSESNFTEIPYEELSLNVYILDMNGNEITEIKPFPEDIKLRRLQLAENKLTAVTYEMFAGLKYMHDIDLSSNAITTIDPDSFRDSPGLITIELQNNPLTHINAGPLLTCRSLLYLDISNCGLSHLNDEFFSEVPFLTTLYLSGNPLTEISLRLVSALVTLEELKLSHCNLTHLHPEFLQGLIHLKILDLSKNDFIDLDWRTILAGLPRLENLNLERSGLLGLPDDVFSNNTWIRSVDLSDNDFSSSDIGTTLGENLKNLHYLDLSNCSLTSLSENSFSSAGKLRNLYLCNNNLLPTELLTSLIPLKKLTVLSLRNCSLPKLPKNIFENLTELEELDISWNPLNNVFEKLLQPLANLQYLDMGYSNLRNLSKNTFVQTTALRKLVLSGNKLGDLEKGLFRELVNLVTLEVNNCGLEEPLSHDVFDKDTYTDLQELKMAGNSLKVGSGALIPKQLSQLKTLDLSNCSIKNLPDEAFSHLEDLTRLLLNSNQLTGEVIEKSRFLKSLKKLEYLDLSSNNITKLSVDTISDTNIRDIKLTNNPWLCDCSIAGWWSWAKSRGDLNHLIGATLTQEDIVKGGSKRKKALLCHVDPQRTPLLPRNATRRTRVEVGTRTWARYLKESPCKVQNMSQYLTTVQVPVLFPEPILPSPGTPHQQVQSVDNMPTSVGLIAAMATLALSLIIGAIYIWHRRRARCTGSMEMSTKKV